MADAYNEEQEMYQNYLPQPTGRKEYGEAALVERLDPYKILEQISHFLKGEIYKPSEDIWEQKLEPLVNNLGHNRLMMCAASIINQNTTLSDLDDFEIGRMCQFLADRIIRLLFLEWEDFKIRRENLDIIWENICDTAYMALKRAKNRGEMKAIKTAVSSQEMVHIRDNLQQDTKKKMWAFGGNK